MGRGWKRPAPDLLSGTGCGKAELPLPGSCCRKRRGPQVPMPERQPSRDPTPARRRVTMSLPAVLVLAGSLGVWTGSPPASIPPVVPSGCCLEHLDEFGFCPRSSFCRPDCYRHWFKNGSTTCIRCVNGTSAHPSTNQTGCIKLHSSSESRTANGTTLGPTILKIGGPGIAASVCLGTLVTGSLFILCVAAFFYLKRSNKLEDLFCQQGKGSILQPSEVAGAMSSSTRSGDTLGRYDGEYSRHKFRKERYSRRERLSTSVASAAMIDV
ncbi:uncharacterized protein C1orf159 homolog isoform X2 [Narcine bancroftii]|uniref:uncharacterized protein C1orf159 homolog isoform X2 n=1 Tax=Narcine bancroftii TaxID=1343680 RepID=UPI003831B03E